VPLLMGGSPGVVLDASYVVDSSCLISFHVIGCLSGCIGNLLHHHISSFLKVKLVLM
jgi:hypothetical protein